ncbi:hypothetical protein PsorP6_001246 [Peronosclerospora sorghi]|uniref:Uncharacterized protein n=1 Tax=Peronosclerospora sorghi TaxID=230839 RepID=A0ACC0WQ89_9STRA|nr:hypothetical protein PsorP6_001246 [Peronosclerospora sorghi]
MVDTTAPAWKSFKYDDLIRIDSRVGLINPNIFSSSDPCKGLTMSEAGNLQSRLVDYNTIGDFNEMRTIFSGYHKVRKRVYGKTISASHFLVTQAFFVDGQLNTGVKVIYHQR